MSVGNARCAQAGQAVAGQIEVLAVWRTAGAEEGGGAREGREHGVAQFGTYFVAVLGDARADDGRHAGRHRAKGGHGGNRGFQHAGGGAAPAGVHGPDHAGLGIVQQHRRAVGRDDPEGQSWAIRDEGISGWALAGMPGRLHGNDRCAMNLMQAEQVGGADAEGSGDAGAVLGDVGGVVAAGLIGVEAGVRADADAAAAGEETMAGGERLVGQELGGHASNPGGGGTAGWVMASALNSWPMRLGAARRSAASRKALA